MGYWPGLMGLGLQGCEGRTGGGQWKTDGQAKTKQADFKGNDSPCLCSAPKGFLSSRRCFLPARSLAVLVANWQWRSRAEANLLYVFM
jgi:hypothetical protein